MTFGTPPAAAPLPRRGRQLIPANLPRRREVLAVFAVTIVAGHLVFAPVTLIVAILLAAAGRAIRWRPWWLLCPAAAGLAWALATGPGAALAHITAWPSGILGPLNARHGVGHHGHPLAAFRLAWSSLPGQLPVALICGAAEAAVLGWLDWLHTDAWAVPPRRSGLLSLVRGRLAGAAIRAGAVLTRDGCALGVAKATGGVAELRWAEMAGGLLITGDDSRDVTLASLQVVHAALRRRKPLLAFDHGAESATGRPLAAACLATGTPLRTDGSAAGVARAPGGASASGLWGRAGGGLAEGSQGLPGAARTAVDPHQVIMERSAALLPADSAEAAARACANLAALARDLRAIGVDGDGLIWIPRGDLVPQADLAALLRGAPPAGLQVLIGATSRAAVADLADLADLTGLVGAALALRVTDNALASRLADLTGVRMLPGPAASGQPAAPAVPGVPEIPGTGLVRCPVVSPRTLQTLGRGEFVLAVNVPRGRLIARGRLIPARLPRRAEPSHHGKPPRREPPPHREERRFWRAPEVAGR
jgi:hypothetical protein